MKKVLKEFLDAGAEFEDSARNLVAHSVSSGESIFVVRKAMGYLETIHMTIKPICQDADSLLRLETTMSEAIKSTKEERVGGEN